MWLVHLPGMAPSTTFPPVPPCSWPVTLASPGPKGTLTGGSKEGTLWLEQVRWTVGKGSTISWRGTTVEAFKGGQALRPDKVHLRKWGKLCDLQAKRNNSHQSLKKGSEHWIVINQFSIRGKKLDHSFDPNLCQRDYLKMVWEQITKSMGSNEAASVP